MLHQEIESLILRYRHLVLVAHLLQLQQVLVAFIMQAIVIHFIFNSKDK